MPIYLYVCPMGHTTEFLKLAQDEEPKTCKEYGSPVAHFTEICGLPLTKIIGASNWRYTRGKNISWP